MKYVWMLALAGIFSFQSELFSQSLSGRVSDAKTQLPLASASITLAPGTSGAVSDASGAYRIRLKEPGSYTVRVTYLGYAPFDTTMSITGNAVLNVALNAVPMPGPEIEVSAIRAKDRYSPVTFSNVTTKDLQEKYTVQDVPVLLADLPSATFYSENGNGIGYSHLRIRGFDQTRMAIMINGVPQNDPEDHDAYWIDFSDLLGSVQEIQVQRGAGSAFYGPPAIGGSINIITGDFANQKGVRISSGLGNYNTQKYAMSFGSGLIDGKYTMFGRISNVLSDGYRDRSWVDANAFYFSATRYDETMTTRINVYGGPISDGLAYYGLPKFAVTDPSLRTKNYNYWEAGPNGYTYTIDRRKDEVEGFSQPHFEILNEWKLSPATTLNNTVFYVIGQGYFDYDGTGWTDKSYFRMTPQYGFDSTTADPENPLIRAYVDNRQIGWLPRITIDHTDGTLSTGLELRLHRSLHWGKIQSAGELPGNYDPDRKYYQYHGGKDIGSWYAQEMYHPTPQLNLMGNLQLAFNQYRLFKEDYIGTDFKVRYFFINPRFGLNYNFDERLNFYFNASYTSHEPRLVNLYQAGESSGGATPQFAQKADGSYDFSNPLVKPESLLNLELGEGYRSTSMQILANVYLMNFRDEIIKSGRLDRFGQPITGNADRTLHYGLEVSASWSPLPQIEISGNALASRARLMQYSVWVPDPNTQTLVDSSLSGNRIAGFPEYLANIKLGWRNYGCSVLLTWKFVGDQYTDNFQNPNNKVDPYSVLNAMIGYKMTSVLGFRGVEFRLAVNNLLNKLYAQSGEGEQFFVAADRNLFFDITVDF